MKNLFFFIFSLVSFVSFGQQQNVMILLEQAHLQSLFAGTHPDSVLKYSIIRVITKPTAANYVAMVLKQDQNGNLVSDWTPQNPQIGDTIRVFKRGNEEIAFRNESRRSLIRAVEQQPAQKVVTRNPDPMYGEGGTVARNERRRQPQRGEYPQSGQQRRNDGGQGGIFRNVYQVPPGAETYHPGHSQLLTTREDVVNNSGGGGALAGLIGGLLRRM